MYARVFLIVPACVDTAPAGVCLSVTGRSVVFEKVQAEKGKSEEPNQPIRKQISRLGRLRGVR